MSNPAIFTTEGSYGRAWALQLLDSDGSPIDLTNATSPTFSMKLRGSTTRKIDAASAEVANGTYTLPDGSSRAFTPTDGVLIYQPDAVAGDADTPGVYVGQFTYQLSGAPVRDPGVGYVDIFVQEAI